MGLDIWFSRETTEEIGYFRKVNFLVKFFEDRGLDVEEQQPLRIDKEDAEELLDSCNQVLEDHSKADELLPTMGGFFFGDTDYDEYYFNDVERVRDFIRDKLLPEFDKLDPNQGIYFDIWY